MVAPRPQQPEQAVARITSGAAAASGGSAKSRRKSTPAATRRVRACHLPSVTCVRLHATGRLFSWSCGACEWRAGLTSCVVPPTCCVVCEQTARSRRSTSKAKPAPKPKPVSPPAVRPMAPRTTPRREPVHSACANCHRSAPPSLQANDVDMSDEASSSAADSASSDESMPTPIRQPVSAPPVLESVCPATAWRPPTHARARSTDAAARSSRQGKARRVTLQPGRARQAPPPPALALTPTLHLLPALSQERGDRGRQQGHRA